MLDIRRRWRLLRRWCIFRHWPPPTGRLQRTAQWSGFFFQMKTQAGREGSVYKNPQACNRRSTQLQKAGRVVWSQISC